MSFTKSLTRALARQPVEPLAPELVPAAKVTIDHRGVNDSSMLGVDVPSFAAVRKRITVDPGAESVWRVPRCLFELVTVDGRPVFSGVIGGEPSDMLDQMIVDHGVYYGAAELRTYPLGEFPRHDCCVEVAEGPPRNGVQAYSVHDHQITPDDRDGWYVDRIFGATPGKTAFV